MTRINTKAFALFLKAGVTPPTPPTNYLELKDKLFLTGKPKVESYDRFNGSLLTKDSYADVCDTTQEGVTLAHLMKFTNAAADALDTLPEYSEQLKIGGFTEETGQALIFVDVTGLSIGDAITGDTSLATGTVFSIDATSKRVFLSSVAGTFEVGGEALNTAAYTSTTAGLAVGYKLNKASSPTLGSAIYYIDGNKQTMTNSIAMNTVFDFKIGMGAMITSTMNTFFDNEGVPTKEANPAVTLNTDDGIQIVSCTDLYDENGAVITGVSKVTVDMGAQLQKFYGMSLKEYETTSFEPTITVEFPLDQADYGKAITLIKDQTYFDIVVEIGRFDNLMVNGKSTRYTITQCKLSDFDDTDDKDTIKRTHNIVLTPESEFTIDNGYFVP